MDFSVGPVVRYELSFQTLNHSFQLTGQPWQLKSLKRVVETLKAHVANVPEEEKDKHASIMKRIRQAKLQVANTLLVQ
jgi:hypothetical protein